MQRLLDKINISSDDSIKAVVTDEPTTGNVGTEARIVGYTFIIIGVLLGIFSLFLLSIFIQYNLFLAPFLFLFGGEIQSSGMLVVKLIGITIVLGIAVISFTFGLKQLQQKATWYTVLYPNYLVFKYRENGAFTEKKVHLLAIRNCFIIPTRKPYVQFSRIKPRVRFEFSVNIHLEYEENDELHYLSMPLASQYNQLNKLITYVQQEQHIPMYYSHVRMTKKESTQPVTSLDPVNFEMIEFNGDLKEYVRS